jgi:hypothetical protein
MQYFFTASREAPRLVACDSFSTQRRLANPLKPSPTEVANQSSSVPAANGSPLRRLLLPPPPPRQKARWFSPWWRCAQSVACHQAVGQGCPMLSPHWWAAREDRCRRCPIGFHHPQRLQRTALSNGAMSSTTPPVRRLMIAAVATHNVQPLKARHLVTAVSVRKSALPQNSLRIDRTCNSP